MVGARFSPGGHHHLIQGCIQTDDVQRFPPGHSKAFALADGEVLNAVVLSHHRAIEQHDLTIASRQVGVEKGPHRAVVVSEAEILAFGLLGCSQPESFRLKPCIGLGEFAQGKHQTAKGFLRQVVEEIALVFAAVQSPQQLMATVLAPVAMANPGVVTGGNARDAAFLLSPSQHRSEFHLPIATGAGQRGDTIGIALHQKVNDLLFEMFAEVHHVVGHAKLLADSGCIHQAFSAASPLPTHQPEGQAFHLPARLHQQGGGQGAVDTARETHSHAVLAGPLTQPFEGLLAGHGRRRVGGRGAGDGGRSTRHGGFWRHGRHRWISP